HDDVPTLAIIHETRARGMHDGRSGIIGVILGRCAGLDRDDRGQVRAESLFQYGPWYAWRPGQRGCFGPLRPGSRPLPPRRSGGRHRRLAQSHRPRSLWFVVIAAYRTRYFCTRKWSTCQGQVKTAPRACRPVASTANRRSPSALVGTRTPDNWTTGPLAPI